MFNLHRNTTSTHVGTAMLTFHSHLSLMELVTHALHSPALLLPHRHTQEDDGELVYVVIKNDGEEQNMIWLINLKNIFSKAGGAVVQCASSTPWLESTTQFQLVLTLIKRVEQCFQLEPLWFVLKAYTPPYTKQPPNMPKEYIVR